MKISVITISYNAAECIERTIKSVINQKDADYEYIIVDGNSSDGTQNIIQKYSKSISKWISEPDSGIYCAMNKGTRMASGEYCLYLNAGDMLVDDNVLKRVWTYLDGTSICTGNQISVLNCKLTNYSKSEEKVDRLFFYGRSLCHQATFFLREDVLETPYDETYRMISDWKLESELILLKSKSYKSMNVDVCYFVQDGVTFTNMREGKLERMKALTEIFDEDELKTLSDKRSWQISKYNPKHIYEGFIRQVRKLCKTIQYRDVIKNLSI